MRFILCPALGLALLATAACDEVAVANDPEALGDVRGAKSCIRAVSQHTGKAGVTVNTSIPVIELNRYIVDVRGAKSWSCVTDANGKAKEIVEIGTG